MASVEELKRVAKRFAVDAWNGDVAIFDEVCSPDYRLGEMTLNDLKQAILAYRQGVPDLTASVGDMIAEGDTVAYRWTMSGTHLGTYLGIAATGKPVTATGITILHFRDGKVLRDEFESSSKSFEEQVS
jgi:steroid delta-isomerase-like uncharacterized protein